MITEANLHTHSIGFPYYANSKNGDIRGNTKEKNDRIETDVRASVYKPLYELSNNYLENSYSILYAAESLPKRRDKIKVVENIRSVNNDQAENVENNISKGLLTVIDSDTTYQKSASGRDIVDFLLSNVSNMQQKLQKKTKGTIIFNAPDPFFSHGKYDIFMEFEEEVSKALPNNTGLLCWYKRKWLNNFSLAQAISVLADHKHTVHSDWKYKEWDTNKIIDVVSKGIDNNLGEGSSTLLFYTMKSAYKLDQDTIVYRPAIFEETLKRLLGKGSASSVVDSIFDEIIKEVGFSLTADISAGKTQRT